MLTIAITRLRLIIILNVLNGYPFLVSANTHDQDRFFKDLVYNISVASHPVVDQLLPLIGYYQQRGGL